MMSDFYRKLDEAEIRGRAERMVGNRPENLHDYQGCANNAAQGVGPCGPGPFKWFRCFDCGYSGEITTEEIAAHRSLCARGTTEPLADQARAAEQGQEDNYVAWGCYGKNGRNETIIKLCDSDAPGAFKMFRACNHVHLEDIGTLRANLLVPFDCNWNGLVRDVTAQYETDGKSNVYEVFKELVSTVRQSGHLDHSFPERDRIKDLFADRSPEHPTHPPAGAKPCRHGINNDGEFCPDCATTPKPAGDVVERIAQRFSEMEGEDDITEHVRVAVELAREGYVSLADMERAIRVEATRVLYGPKAAETFITSVRNRLAKPAERVTVMRSDFDPFDQVSVWLDGKEECCNLLPLHAERYAAGLRQELRDGKEGK